MLVLPATLAAAAALCAGAAYVTVAPRSRFWGHVIHRGSADAPPRYALTFDDGPTEGPTDQILDALAAHNAKAAFFVIGVNARKAPHLVRRMHDEGHVVGNHSLDHSHYGVMRMGWYWNRQIRETDAIIADIIGRKPALYRPPMGVRHLHIMASVKRHGLTAITWSRRALDGVTTTPERILHRLAPNTHAGDILVLHDGLEPHNLKRDPSATVAAIGPLIARLRDRGLEPARLDELIGIPAYAR